MIEIKNLNKTFKNGIIRKNTVHAVKDVSFSIKKGQTLGLAGNSGCGKSTISKMILGLIKPDSGQILVDNQDLMLLNQNQLKSYRKKVQIIFQHPDSSLNPQKKIFDSLLEPMKIHNMYTKDERIEKVYETIKLVGLNERLLDRYPHQISGGEAQRVIISRALTLNPEILILDEPTSMLDVSIQAHIMNILKGLQQKLNLTYLFISHDLDVLKYLSDDLAIMNKGEIIEIGKCDEIINNPKEEFSKKLISDFSLF